MMLVARAARALRPAYAARRRASAAAHAVAARPASASDAPRDYGQVDDAFLAALSDICATTTTPDVLRRHGDDESYHEAIAPDVVAFPESTEDVSKVAALCHANRVPLVPFGVGTSLEGHIQHPFGGVSLDLGRLDQMVSEHPDDMDCRAQAGMTRSAVNAALRHTGLEFTVDPGADATVGGMAACGASGTTAVRYGTMRDAVLGLTVVLADGSVVETGGRARKSSAGYDLTKLFVGSEGTLGIITEVALRLHPQPTAVAAATARFDDLDDAVAAVHAILLHGVPVARCELLDAPTMEAFNAYNANVAGFEPQETTPSLFLEFHGLSDAVVKEEADLALQVCADMGGRDVAWAAEEEDRNRLWAARHSTYYASCALKKDGKAIVTDACVPISKLAEVVRATADDVKAHDVVGPIFGHAGDGNFHCILVYNDEDDEDYLARLHKVNANLIDRTLDAGGTCTGEHGVGSGKKKYLAREKGAAGVAAMRALKGALDPRGVMNPGKVFD